MDIQDALDQLEQLGHTVDRTPIPSRHTVFHKVDGLPRSQEQIISHLVNGTPLHEHNPFT
jgi:hypothetical protein